MLLIAALSLLIMISGVDQAKAEAIAPENVVDTFFADDSSQWPSQTNIYRVDSVIYWLENSTDWQQYGNYYVCQIYTSQTLQTCYFFNDYTQLTYDSQYQYFRIAPNMQTVRVRSGANANTYPSLVDSNLNTNQMIWYSYSIPANARLYTNLKTYLKTGQLLSPDMTDYENNYWKYELDYQDFIISIYDQERPSDVNSYPFDIFINRENFSDTRITIYNVLSNQFVAEFTEYNLDYQYDDRFIGFSHELKEGEVVRIITTSTEIRDYYITNMYTQEQILISEVVDNEADYLNNEGTITPVTGMIDPPAKGMIVSVVEYQDYGNMDKLFGDVNSFISSTSSKAFIIFKPIGDLFNSLHPTLRSAIISLFVLYLAGVCIILLRRG